MKEIFHARKVRMCMPRDWNAAMLRKALHGPVSCKVPVSLFQNHGDAKIYAIAPGRYHARDPGDPRLQ